MPTCVAAKRRMLIMNYELTMMFGMSERCETLRLCAEKPMIYGVGEVAVKVINKHINRIMNKIFIVINNQIHSL